MVLVQEKEEAKVEEKKEAKEEVLKNQEEWDQEEVVGKGKVVRMVGKEVTISVPWILWVILGVHLVDPSLVRISVEMEPF